MLVFFPPRPTVQNLKIFYFAVTVSECENTVTVKNPALKKKVLRGKMELWSYYCMRLDYTILKHHLNAAAGVSACIQKQQGNLKGRIF